jgi:hypothetical protein
MDFPPRPRPLWPAGSPASSPSPGPTFFLGAGLRRCRSPLELLSRYSQGALGLALFVFAEKLVPARGLRGRAGGVALILWGGVTLLMTIIA